MQPWFLSRLESLGTRESTQGKSRRIARIPKLDTQKSERDRKKSRSSVEEILARCRSLEVLVFALFHAAGIRCSRKPEPNDRIISDEVIPANLRCDNDADIMDNTIYYCYDDKLIARVGRYIDASHFIHVLYHMIRLHYRKPTMKRAFIVCSLCRAHIQEDGLIKRI